ncbi:AraC family transcriptional regulator [Saccharopolyspora thermophila]|uniref:AraC family transcriptional regulator n=1 Tax=Saccharopolyspora thermophila TaxID=89367 RepID=A0ABN1C8G8_9PSEU
MYFARGEGRHVLDGEVHELADGDVYLIPPGHVHDLSGIDQDAKGWAIEFSASALDGMTCGGTSTALWRANPLLRSFAHVTPGGVSARLRVPRPDRAEWTDRCRQMQREYQDNRTGRALALYGNLLLLLIDIARLAESRAEPVQRHLRAAQDPVLAEVFAVIEEYWATDLGPADVAARVGLTPAYLTTLVRERTGRPLSAWILERKMAEARTLLLSTDRSVESIAAAVGFSDPAHFNRRFRQVHGLPPGRWRNNQTKS